MWTQYDEDLSQNDFFKEIKVNNGDILKKATEQNWIICVPKQGSVKCESLSADTVLNHVLVTDEDRLFTTLSKRTVHLHNHRLKPQGADVFHPDIEVLFEETHYSDQMKKYTVWCLSSALFGDDSEIHTRNDASVKTLQDSIDFLYEEDQGCDLLENISKSCKEFWKCFETFETEPLQSQKDCLGIHYSQCLQCCLQHDIIKNKCHQNVNYFNNFKLAVETYMQYRLGHRLIYSVNTLEHKNDANLNKILRNSSDVTLETLGVAQEFKTLALEARAELSRINSFTTILDKVNCLLRVFDKFNSGKTSQSIGADDFLQLLVYTILQCRVYNWLANLTYLKEYQFVGFKNFEQANFLVSNLEAALTFITSQQFLSIRNCNSHLSDSQLTLFDRLYLKLKTTLNPVEFNELLEQEAAKANVKLCHPLCVCSKCEQTSNLQRTEHPTIVNSLKQNFLIKATIDNDLSFVQYLLSVNFDSGLKDVYGKTALHYAAEKGYQGILMQLISAANEDIVNSLDKGKNTPLHLACDKGHENCVKALIYSSHFVEVNLQNTLGETPLFLATRWGYIDIVKVLLENWASVCIKNNQQITVYKLATNYHLTKLFETYGRSSAILREASNKTESPAEEQSKSECRREEQGVLLGTVAKNDAQDAKTKLLFQAIKHNDLPLTCFYLGYNSTADRADIITAKCHPLCDCSTCRPNGETQLDRQEESPNRNLANVRYYLYAPLHIAAIFGRTEILRVLLDNGADSALRTDVTRQTALHLAVIYQRERIVKELLLRCGNSTVNSRDSCGNTPLHYACEESNKSAKIIEELLENGADCRIKNAERKSVLEICEEKGLSKFGRMLRKSTGSDEATNDSLDEIVNDFQFL